MRDTPSYFSNAYGYNRRLRIELTSFPIVSKTDHFTYRKANGIVREKIRKLKLITWKSFEYNYRQHPMWNFFIFPYRVIHIFPARARNKCTTHLLVITNLYSYENVVIVVFGLCRTGGNVSFYQNPGLDKHCKIHTQVFN